MLGPIVPAAMLGAATDPAESDPLGETIGHAGAIRANYGRHAEAAALDVIAGRASVGAARAARQRIEALSATAGAPSLSAVLRRALALAVLALADQPRFALAVAQRLIADRDSDRARSARKRANEDPPLTALRAVAALCLAPRPGPLAALAA